VITQPPSIVTYTHQPSGVRWRLAWDVVPSSMRSAICLQRDQIGPRGEYFWAHVATAAQSWAALGIEIDRSVNCAMDPVLAVNCLSLLVERHMAAGHERAPLAHPIPARPGDAIDDILIGELGRLSGDASPPDGWQDRVVHAIADRSPLTDPALSAAVDALGSIMLEMQRRRLMARLDAGEVPGEVRRSRERALLTEDSLTDEQVGRLATDAFETGAMELIRRGLLQDGRRNDDR
jgi:hypothetical protein